MKRKKLLALLLASAMAFGLAACGNGDTPPADGSGASSQPTSEEGTPEESSEEPSESSEADAEESTEGGSVVADGTFENKVIMGNTTDLTGDFRFPGWGTSSVGASDQDIGRLTIGYGTQEVAEDGNLVWNDTAVKSHTETENEDGTATYTVEINEGLTFSDGTPITAKNYLATTLSFASPVSMEAGRPGTSGMAFVGYQEFHDYTGEEAEGTSKEFSGIRLLGDYSFSFTVSSDYYPYYFAYTYAAVDPAPLGLVLGEGVDILDDGNGVYLSESFYEKNGDSYVKAAEIEANRYDLTKYPFSGAYVVSDWDASTKQATMTINPAFKGNYEGQVPSIETIVYVKLTQETQLEMLTTGGTDILGGVTGGKDTTAALAVVDGENFTEVHYQRAGYGKIQFDCDFGPTMFQEVRQAVTYLLNRTEFCQTSTGGYGVVVDGPYSPDLAPWRAVQDEIELIDYSFSPETAKKVLEDGGWIYNSKGEAYEEGAEGVDAVRYKKLTADEANVLDGINKTYASVSNTDGVTYQTVEVNGEYYMPLAINWFGSSPNEVTDLISTTLANSSDLAAAGMVVRATTGDFDKLLGEIYREPTYGYNGTPTYGMYNLATGFSALTNLDTSYQWSHDPAWFTNSSNKLYDPYDIDFPYDLKADKLSYEEAVEASGDKLGMDYLSMAMVYNAATEDEFNQWYMGYVERWNELMPDIPLYSNFYYDVYNAKIENFQTSPFRGPAAALLYANVKGF